MKMEPEYLIPAYAPLVSYAQLDRILIRLSTLPAAARPSIACTSNQTSRNHGRVLSEPQFNFEK